MTIYNTHKTNMIFEIPQVCSFFNAKKKQKNETQIELLLRQPPIRNNKKYIFTQN